MKIFYSIIIVLLFSNLACAQQKQDALFVAFWNVENLFDVEDDPITDDAEWNTGGVKDWSAERVDKKMYNLARVIRSMNEYEGPDLFGLCEVEHQYLLDSLINKYLSDKNYKTAYLESPDARGIDNGIIYNSDILKVLSVKGYETQFNDGSDTRLVLHGTFLFNSHDTLHFFVNHWPSRRGGEEESQPRRIKVATTLRTVIDSLYKVNAQSKLIIAGDFNDEPTNVSILDYLKASPFICDKADTENLPENIGTDLFNLSYKAYADGIGSFFYQADFNMIDQIIVSKNIIMGNKLNYICNSYEVFKPDMMITRTGKFQGAPFPTYGGSRYLGGYSDHFPVVAKFKIFK